MSLTLRGRRLRNTASNERLFAGISQNILVRRSAFPVILLVVVNENGVVASGFRRLHIEHRAPHQRLVEERDVTLAGARHHVIQQRVERSARGGMVQQGIRVDWKGRDYEVE